MTVYRLWPRQGQPYTTPWFVSYIQRADRDTIYRWMSRIVGPTFGDGGTVWSTRPAPLSRSRLDPIPAVMAGRPFVRVVIYQMATRPFRTATLTLVKPDLYT